MSTEEGIEPSERLRKGKASSEVEELRERILAVIQQMPRIDATQSSSFMTPNSNNARNRSAKPLASIFCV